MKEGHVLQTLVWCAALLGAAGQQQQRSLRDQPLQSVAQGSSSAPVYLDSDTGEWYWTRASALSQRVAAAVPGDLITDLQRAGVTGDPLFELNFKSDVWDREEFVLHREFNRRGASLLVFEGIKMGAAITIDGIMLGESSNQFSRSVFDISGFAGVSTLHLAIAFPPSNSSINAESRWMACSGAWDWAPYGSTFSPTGSHTFSKGLWKSVYLQKGSTFLSQISTLVFYHPDHGREGGTTAEPLLDGPQAGAWRVLVNTSLLTLASHAASQHCKLTATGEWAPERSVTRVVSLAPKSQSAVVLSLDVPAGTDLDLWRPNGMGNRRMYTVTVEMSCGDDDGGGGGGGFVRASRRIGFRTAHLVTGSPPTAAAATAAADGTGDFTMRLVVNNAYVWARGANFIPVDELEGRVQAETYRVLLQSAADAHFNTLRVWGGGIWQYDLFYDLCDELGLLIIQDAMYGRPWFGGNSGVPAPNAAQEAEVRSNMQRLSPHPSIVLWNGCNECDPLDPDMHMASWLLPLVAQTDPSRAIWPASPSMGFSSGVSVLTGLPNGKPLVPKPLEGASSPRRRVRAACGAAAAAALPIETHGPYQHGEGFKTVNSDAALEPFNPNTPPVLSAPAELGTGCPGNFASEFGASAWSSFESVAPTLLPAHWGLHAPPLVERNYAADNFLAAYFPQRELDGQVGPEALKGQLYLALVAQALQQKSDISARRSGNQFGTLVWQLGEIWPTGGWGSVEYGCAPTPGDASSTAGQVQGGRWKPLHHFMRRMLFTDLFVACGADASCIVKNDGPAAFSGTLRLQLLHLRSGMTLPLGEPRTVELAQGGLAGASAFVCAATTAAKHSSHGCQSWPSALSAASATAGPATRCTVDSCVLLTALEAPGGDVVYSSFELLTPPKNMTAAIPKAHVALRVLPSPDSSWPTPLPLTIQVSANETALFVGLVSKAQGEFSDNFFILPKGTQRLVTFQPHRTGQETALRVSLRADHLASYL